MPVNRARIRRLLVDALAGAALGGLAFIAARALALPAIFGWMNFEAFWPFVLIGALLYVTALRALVWAVAGTLLLVIVVGALTPAIVRPARALVRADPPAQPVDAVAILASGLSDDQLVAPDALDRLISGLALARAERTEAQPDGLPVVLTVTTRGRAPVLSSTGDQQRIVELAGAGIDVHWTEPVHSTRDEARVVAALARAESWRRIAVVTSPLHTRRACATFERVGLAIRCVPAEARDFAVRTLRSPRDRLRATQLWLYEMAGTAYYRLRGWV